MAEYWIKKVFKGIFIGILVIAGIFLFTYVVMYLWNWLMPEIFGLTTLTFWQAGGLLILSKILFSGFRGGHHKSAGKHHIWKHKMMNRWEKMSPEERERFKEKFKRKGFGWCGHTSTESEDPC